MNVGELECDALRSDARVARGEKCFDRARFVSARFLLVCDREQVGWLRDRRR